MVEAVDDGKLFDAFDGRKSAATGNCIRESLTMGKLERMELETANTGEWQRRVRYSRKPCFCMRCLVAIAEEIATKVRKAYKDMGLETISRIDAARLSNMP